MIIQSAFLKLYNMYFSGVFILSVMVLKKSVPMKHLCSVISFPKWFIGAKIPKLVLKSVLKLNDNFCQKNRWTNCIPTCSALELFLIKRKIKGPSWLQVSNFSTCSASQRVRFYLPHLLYIRIWYSLFLYTGLPFFFEVLAASFAYRLAGANLKWLSTLLKTSGILQKSLQWLPLWLSQQ